MESLYFKQTRIWDSLILVCSCLLTFLNRVNANETKIMVGRRDSGSKRCVLVSILQSIIENLEYKDWKTIRGRKFMEREWGLAQL